MLCVLKIILVSSYPIFTAASSYFNQDLIVNINRNINNTEISGKCNLQLETYLQALFAEQLWALKSKFNLLLMNFLIYFVQVFDSSTKFPSGVLEGGVFDLGNFDECLNVNGSNVKGKYCLGTIFYTAEAVVANPILRVWINLLRNFISFMWLCIFSRTSKTRVEYQERWETIQTSRVCILLIVCLMSVVVTISSKFLPELCFMKSIVIARITNRNSRRELF